MSSCPIRPTGLTVAAHGVRCQPAGHDRRYAVDAGKLGWEPQERFESGLRRTLVWYLEHQAWCERVMDGSYRGERLGVPR